MASATRLETALHGHFGTVESKSAEKRREQNAMDDFKLESYTILKTYVLTR
jgi:hypothetical protein